MNAYTFPEHVPTSDAAKSLITRILNGDPARRPSLDEILQHDFFHQGWTIPPLMHVSTLACPPSGNWLKQYMGNANNSMKQSRQRLADTTPGIVASGGVKHRGQGDLLNTERLSKRGSKDRLLKPNTPSERQVFRATPRSEYPASTRNEIKTRPQTTRNEGKVSPSNSTEVWVTKWVDYSQKYGLGYLLSNGSVGVFFNDSTKIILDPKGNQFNYIERRQVDRNDEVATHTLNNYPRELHKKVTLLQHFRSHLDAGSKPDDEQPTAQDLPYIKK